MLSPSASEEVVVISQVEHKTLEKFIKSQMLLFCYKGGTISQFSFNGGGDIFLVHAV